MNDSVRATQRGVTLIELLVAIVIMGIIAGLAVPAMQTFIQNASIRTAAESILNGLQLARGEAVRLNSRVRFVLGAGSAWTVIDEGTGLPVQTRSGGEGASSVVATVTPNPSTTVTFNSFGRRVTNADASNPLASVSLDITPLTTREMRVQIAAGGQIRLCEPAITTAGDVRRCLP